MEGPKAALVASKDFDNGHYKTAPQHGIRAFGRVYSAWAYGQTVNFFFPQDFFDTSFSNSSTSVYSGSGNISTFTMDGKSDLFILFGYPRLVLIS